MSGFDIENLMDVNAEDTNDAESVESSEAGCENDKRLDYSNKTLDQDLLSMVKNISNQIEANVNCRQQAINSVSVN